MIDKNSEFLEESFLFKYGKLKKIKVFNNEVDGFTSDKLLEDVKLMFQKSGYKHSYKYISKIIDSGALIPVVFHKSWITFVVAKIMKNILDAELFKKEINYRGIMGYYTSNENKIYLMITNKLNLLNWINDEDVSKLLVHEFMHYTAANQYSQFYKIWHNVFVDYYIAFFKSIILQIIDKQLDNSSWMKIKKDISRKMLPVIYKTDKLKQNSKMFRDIINMYNKKDGIVRTMFRNYLTEEELDNVFSPVGYYIQSALLNANKLSLMIQQYDILRKIFFALKEAFSEIKMNSDTSEASFHYQELFFLSEISAISTGNIKTTKLLLDSTLTTLK